MVGGTVQAVAVICDACTWALAAGLKLGPRLLMKRKTLFARCTPVLWAVSGEWRKSAVYLRLVVPQILWCRCPNCAKHPWSSTGFGHVVHAR